MKKANFFGLAVILFLVTMLSVPAEAMAQEQQEQEVTQLPISWENWRQAKAEAEKYDLEGDYARALQYYLEYIRQAEGLGRPDIVAWGKNNAAYMIIKQHKEDPTTDLGPAKKLLEEGLQIAEATEDCQVKLRSNLEYVMMFIKD
ncbi:MAG: hypothetical protein PHQ48_02775 [Acidobacteriota bacterium]|nr:hypothetical protein [Acidobacteriota bacterium]MDY0231680.1 hypothetical protein [Candidatus Saccharicenans sp.]